MDELNHEHEFESWWSRDVQLLDAPNRRGNGTSSVGVVDARDWPRFGPEGRLYLKRQQAFFCRPPWNTFRRTPTLRREVRFIRRARELGINVPDILSYAEASGDRAMLLLREVDHAIDLEHAVRLAGSEREGLFENLGKMLTKLHSARILHGAIYPKHVLVEVAAPKRLWLIDFEKARDVVSRSSAAQRDIARLRRHSPFMTNADLEALVSSYDRRAFPRLLERVKADNR